MVTGKRLISVNLTNDIKTPPVTKERYPKNMFNEEVCTVAYAAVVLTGWKQLF